MDEKTKKVDFFIFNVVGCPIKDLNLNYVFACQFIISGSGPNSRDSQMFIAYGEIPGLGDELWETPFGEVVEGMEHVEEFYSYGA